MNLSKAIFSGVLCVPEASGSFHQGEDWKMGQFGICLHPYTLLSIYEFILSSVGENLCQSILLLIASSSPVWLREDPSRWLHVPLGFEPFLDSFHIRMFHAQLAASMVQYWRHRSFRFYSFSSSIWYLEVKVQNLYVLVVFSVLFCFLFLACFSNTGL